MSFPFTASLDSYDAVYESDAAVKRKLIPSFRYIKNKIMTSTAMLLIIYPYIFISLLRSL